MKYRLIFLLVLSIVTKLLCIHLNDIVNPDGIRYFNSAYELAQGSLAAAFAHEKMLVYVWTLGLFHLVIDDWVLAGQLLSLTFLTLAIIPLYALTKAWFGANAAIWASLAFVMLPAANGLATKVVKDGPFLFFLLLALWSGYKALAERRLLLVAATFGFTAAAAMFRFEAIIFLGVYFLWLFCRALFNREERTVAVRGMLVYALVPICCFGVLLGLLLVNVIDILVLKSVWTPFNEHYLALNLLDNYHAIYDHLKSVEKNFPGGQWTNDFFELARYFMPLIYLAGLLQILVVVLFPVNLVPLVWGVWAINLRTSHCSLLFSTVTAYALMAYLYLVSRNFLAERYLMVVVVTLLPLVGLGFERLRLQFRASRFYPLATVIAVAMLVCLPLYKSFADASAGKPEIRQAGEWLRENRDLLQQRMISSDERVPFYAGLMRRSYDVLPEKAMHDSELLARAHGCTLLVIDVAVRSGMNPPEFAEYALVKEFRGEKRAVLIYEAIP